MFLSLTSIVKIKEFFSSYFSASQDTLETTEKLSISDGAFWAVYSAMTSTFIVPLSLIFLGNQAPIGYIIGLPVFLVPFAQYSARRLSRKVADLKGLTIYLTLLDRILWVPVVLLVFVHGYYFRFSLLIVLLSMRTYFASFSGTTWALWIPSVVPPEHRATYFSRRNLVMKLFSVFGYLFALGIFLKIKPEIIALITVFLLGSLLFSTLSLVIMTRIPKFSLEESQRENRTGLNNQVLSFLFFSALWYFGISLVGPYFQLLIVSPYFFGEKQTFYTIVFLFMSISSILTQLFWGKISAKTDHMTVIYISSIIYITATASILFVRNPFFILIPAIMFGISQSGSTLSVFNEMISRSVKSRISSISAYNLVQSLFSAAGPITANIIFDLTHFNISIVFLTSILFVIISVTTLKILDSTLIKHRSV